MDSFSLPICSIMFMYGGQREIGPRWSIVCFFVALTYSHHEFQLDGLLSKAIFHLLLLLEESVDLLEALKWKLINKVVNAGN